MHYCSIIKDRLCCHCFRDSFYKIAQPQMCVNNFFIFFLPNKKEPLRTRSPFIVETEKEGFEPSRRFPDLHP